MKLAAAICGCLLLTACQSGEGGSSPGEGAGPDGADVKVLLELSSDAFGIGDALPPEHTCDGADLSPPLSWPAGPDETAAYALVVDDPDAPRGTWVHWVAWNIAGTELDQGITPADVDLVQGLNSWDEVGYRGPCPPPGPEHRYSFRVYALDSNIDLGSDATVDQLEAAMLGHVLAEGELEAPYGRQS